MLIKSPSGSLCPYYYMGGELHPLKYRSYYNDNNKLFAVMQTEEEFILKSSGEKRSGGSKAVAGLQITTEKAKGGKLCGIHIWGI